MVVVLVQAWVEVEVEERAMAAAPVMVLGTGMVRGEQVELE